MKFAVPTGRIDVPTFFPKDLIVDQNDNSRVQLHTKEEIQALAASILEHGQESPCLGRKVEGNNVKLVLGYGRHAAVTYINEVLQPDNPIKLQVRVQDMNPEEAFVKSIVENFDRKQPSAIDDAHAQRILRERYNWPEDKIADFYKKSVSYIGQLRKLTQLDAETQKKVTDGTLPVSTAVTLTEIPEADRPQVLAAATNAETGAVSTEVVKRSVRQHKARTGSTNGTPSRSMKEVRQFLEGLLGPGETEAVRTLSKKILEFVGGKISEAQMENALKKWTLGD